MEILKLLNDSTEHEVKNSAFKVPISYDKLLPFLSEIVLLRPDEYTKGFVINDEGITVSIGRKPGRKVKNENEENKLGD